MVDHRDTHITMNVEPLDVDDNLCQGKQESEEANEFNRRKRNLR